MGKENRHSVRQALCRFCSPWNIFKGAVFFRLKVVGIFLGELRAQPPDAAVEVALHQRLKGGKITPLNGGNDVLVVGDHLVQPAAGHGVQHPETAVIGVGVL